MKKILLYLLFSHLYVLCHAQGGTWTWMKGDSTAGSGGVYGTQGLPSPSNTPPGVYQACRWVDLDGNFWIYGGNNIGTAKNALWKFDPVTNEWTWMHGSSTGNPNPVYGTQGVPDASNTPGARAWGISAWTDSLNNLWMFGGYMQSSSYTGLLQDLWKYDISTNEWTWMKGPIGTNGNGTFGTIGVPAPNNNPGSRYEAGSSWIDGSNLWLFGGQGYGSSAGSSGLLNDLWKYDMSTNEWTWISGSSSINPSGSYGTIGVPDATNQPPGRMSHSNWKDSDGNFWIFGGGSYLSGFAFNDMWKYDVAANVWTWMHGTSSLNHSGSYDTLCKTKPTVYPLARSENTMSWTTNEGCLFWLFGGNSEQPLHTYSDLWAFSPDSNKFTLVRGSNSFAFPKNYGTQGVPDPDNYPLSRKGGHAWVASNGELWMFGGFEMNSIFGYLNDAWKYEIDPGCPVTFACALLPPSASLASTSTSICEATCIDFTDLSSNGPTSWEWSFPGGTPASSTDQNPSNICYYSSGSYDVTLIVTNAYGSDTVVMSNFITVNTAPTVSISQSTNILTSTTGSTYQWYLDGIIIPGATSQSYVATQTGVYTVVITDANGCAATTDYFFSAAFFSSSDTTLCEKFCIDFFDLSVNNPVSWQWSFPGANPTSSADQDPANICYDDPGIFDVSLITTDGSGNTDTLTLDDFITVFQNPFAPVITQNGNILTSSPAVSYQWQLNGVDISGATNQSYEITEAGLYTVIITDANGCIAQSSIKADYVGIEDVEENYSVSIYPNPSNGKIVIELTGIPLNAEFSLNIFSTLGQRLFSTSEKSITLNWKRELDLTEASPGIYFLEIKSGERFVREKIILSE